ncbi:hypothetical protein RchiOBHm_Chr4g0406881 [Rosa chinensis]|uniref:Uncharacterized protein n=1 Tax=Rosa chinensis TaxID=74649 RepID=A0A2P6QUF9_ROSCH|nr:hypothetical protein RchiOBHm_Chr4g0406881 [Rosa chinensis]
MNMSCQINKLSIIWGRQLTRCSLPSGCCVSDRRLCLERCCLQVSNLWCFHRASEKGHVGAAIADGSLFLQGVEVLESVMNLTETRQKWQESDFRSLQT